MIEPSPYGPPPGSAPAPHGSVPEASPIMAAVLSLLLPGLGHIYARRTLRGLAWLTTPFLFSVALAVLMGIGGRPFLVFLAIELFSTLGVRVAVVFDSVWTLRRHPGPRSSVVRLVVAAVLIVAALEANSLALRRLVVESQKIPAGSMVPTLVVGDHVFVDKLRSPERADLLIFPLPEHPEQEFLKRVLGMPGDRLEFRNGHPVINGVAVPSCLVGQASYEAEAPVVRHEGTLYLERLGGQAHLAFYDETGGYGPDYQGPYVVKADEVFLVGDNRANSHDSRMWWGGQGGGVPISTVKGVPFVVWLSVNEHGTDWSRVGLDLSSPHLPGSMAQLQPALDACLAKNLGP